MAWVLVDGGVDPVSVLISTITVVPPTPPTFEVGKNYVMIEGDGTVFHIVHQIDSNNFVFWYQTSGGGYIAGIAINSQRGLVEEV